MSPVRRSPMVANERGASFLMFVMFLAAFGAVAHMWMLASMQKTDETRGKMKQGLAALEASEQLAVLLRNSYDMYQAYKPTCPTGTSHEVLHGVHFCFSTASTGKCVKNPLDPSLDLCLQSAQVELSLHRAEPAGSSSELVAKSDSTSQDAPEFSALPSRLLWETASAAAPGAHLPDLVSPPSSAFTAPSCTGSPLDPLCKLCTGNTVNQSMDCIDMVLCLKSSCPQGKGTYQQTIGFPHY